MMFSSLLQYKASMQPSSVSQEPKNAFSFLSKLSDFAIDAKFTYLNSNGYSPVLPNFLYFDGVGGLVGDKKLKVVASLSYNNKGASSISKFFTQFNRAIRFHCEKIPIGFASVRAGSEDSNGVRDDGFGVMEEEGLPLNGVESKNPKKVLILMSDTGGGHRASAEAIKAAFNEEFGDEYQVSF